MSEYNHYILDIVEKNNLLPFIIDSFNICKNQSYKLNIEIPLNENAEYEITLGCFFQVMQEKK